MELKERGDLAWRKDGREKRTEEGRSDVELRGREKANFTFPGKAESGQGRVQAWEDRQPHRMQRERGRVRRHGRNKLLRDVWTAPRLRGLPQSAQQLARWPAPGHLLCAESRCGAGRGPPWLRTTMWRPRPWWLRLSVSSSSESGTEKLRTGEEAL